MELLGNSIQIKEINQIIRQVAPTDISVLITGESGTGKEVVANCIHEYSKRKDKAFITVNCGAIPEGIIESELFGHQKGAFTGAIENREGYFEMAAKGTIFLDEIGDMPLATQVKILRVLESGEFLRVGGNKNIHVDVRVVAATNKNLSQEVINKNFREDLYFRLRLVNIHIPPLRERKSDVKVLFEHFIDEVCKKNGIEYRGIEDDAMEFLINYVWYGNARELKNFCESIVVLNPNKKLALADVKKNLHSEFTQPRQLPAVPLITKDYSEKDLIMRALFELKSDILDIKKLLKYKDNEINSIQTDSDFFINRDRIKNMDDEEIDKEILVYLLRLHDWDVKKVSDNLNQTPRNVYRKIKKYNIIKNF
ncbi:MAG: sigma-54 dependent transcriptional regulator [Ignavibacteria bacterium]|nr:sigma-54 dependent transcriptional regulator [Ignavibacteria bacterium]